MENKQLVDRYIALWNEPDPAIRRKLIGELWAPDGGQLLADPPEEVRIAARNLSFPLPAMEVRGQDVLEARVTRAYEMFIAPGEDAFVLEGEVSELMAGVVAFGWTMTAIDGGEVAGRGTEVLRLDAKGRIRTDFQFIEGS